MLSNIVGGGQDNREFLYACRLQAERNNEKKGRNLKNHKNLFQTARFFLIFWWDGTPLKLGGQ